MIKYKYVTEELIQEVIDDHPTIPEENIRRIARFVNKKYFREEEEASHPLNMFNMIKN